MANNRSRKKKRRWHLKPAGIALLAVILALLVMIICILLPKEENGDSPSSDTAGPSSVEQTGGEPQSSAPSSSGTDPSAESTPSEPEASLPEIPTPTEIPYGSFGAGSLQFSEEDSLALTYIDEEGTEYPLPIEAFLKTLPAGELTDWNLILLNPEEENKIDNDMDISMTKFDTQWVDTRAADAYQAMFDAAQAANPSITLYLRSGYRSIATQTTNYNNNVQSLMSQGLDEAEAIRQTQMYFTVPGHSEHHTGLAFDILTPEYHTQIYRLDERFAETDAYPWLIENCAEYGFILRYPLDKEDITQISYESWHFRYVGTEHAKFMQKYNLCLEEYVQLLKLRDAQ